MTTRRLPAVETVGGVPGEQIPISGMLPPVGWQASPTDDQDDDEDDEEEESPDWVIYRQGHSEAWNLINQNWTMQLVPATSPSIPTILSTQPQLSTFPTLELPDLTGLSNEEFQWLSHH